MIVSIAHIDSCRARIKHSILSTRGTPIEIISGGGGGLLPPKGLICPAPHYQILAPPYNTNDSNN